MIIRVIATLVLIGLAGPVAAEERGFTITSFNRIEVNGPFSVRVTTGRGPSARAVGDARAINEIAVSVTGRTLRVRRNVSSDWGGFPGREGNARAVLNLTTPELERAMVSGAGDLEIDHMEGGRILLSLGGGGRLAVRDVEADDMQLTLIGSGIVEAGGAAETGHVTVQGAGILEAPELEIDNLRIDLTGPGSANISAGRAAEVTSTGTGTVTVFGSPACQVQRLGGGQVFCGGGVD